MQLKNLIKAEKINELIQLNGVDEINNKTQRLISDF